MSMLTWPVAAACGAVVASAMIVGCSAPASAPATPAAQTAAPAAGAGVPAAPPDAAAPAAVPVVPAAAAAATPAAAAAPGATTARPTPAARAAASSPASSAAAVAAAPVAAPASAAAAAPKPAPAPPAPVFREVTVPSGTALSIELKSAHASDTSRIEETVRGVLQRPLAVDGVEIAPAGTAVTGQITAADRAGKVKGRARLVLRFSSIVIDQADTAISTAAIAREAASTKKADAAKIGIGAGAGAVIGAIAGGKKGAVVGGTIGAGAGTGVVLATRGDEVDLAAGTTLSTTLSQPLVVRVRVP